MHRYDLFSLQVNGGLDE